MIPMFIMMGAAIGFITSEPVPVAPRQPRALSTEQLRADFDALPIQEVNDLDYKSEIDGVAHLCGHDGHTAMLLGAATVLSGMKDSLPGAVVVANCTTSTSIMRAAGSTSTTNATTSATRCAIARPSGVVHSSTPCPSCRTLR